MHGRSRPDSTSKVKVSLWTGAIRTRDSTSSSRDTATARSCTRACLKCPSHSFFAMVWSQLFHAQPRRFSHFPRTEFAKHPSNLFFLKHGHLRVTYSGATPSVLVFLGGWTSSDPHPFLFFSILSILSFGRPQTRATAPVARVVQCSLFPSPTPLDAHAFCCADAAT